MRDGKGLVRPGGPKRQRSPVQPDGDARSRHAQKPGPVSRSENLKADQGIEKIPDRLWKTDDVEQNTPNRTVQVGVVVDAACKIIFSSISRI